MEALGSLAMQGSIVVLDGRSGKPANTFPIEQHASDCVVFADLSGRGWPSEILVKTRYGQIWAYTPLPGACSGRSSSPAAIEPLINPFPSILMATAGMKSWPATLR